MRILTTKYPDFDQIAPAIRAFLEALAKSYDLTDNIECVYVGKVSHYRRLKEPDFKGLTYDDAYVIVVETNLKNAKNYQMTVANAVGLTQGINSPEKISMSSFIAIFKNIHQHKLKEIEDEK